MKITPLDVGNHRFPKKWRGYDPAEVDIFLEMVSQEMEEIIQENRYLAEELKKKSQELAEYKEKEQILKETLLTAQKIAEDMKANMVKEAQAIVAQAELEHDMIIRRAQERVLELQEEIQNLRADRARFREELRALINTYLALLEAGEEKEKEEKAEDENRLMFLPRKQRKTGE